MNFCIDDYAHPLRPHLAQAADSFPRPEPGTEAQRMIIGNETAADFAHLCTPSNYPLSNGAARTARLARTTSHLGFRALVFIAFCASQPAAHAIFGWGDSEEEIRADAINACIETYFAIDYAENATGLPRIQCVNEVDRAVRDCAIETANEHKEDYQAALTENFDERQAVERRYGSFTMTDLSRKRKTALEAEYRSEWEEIELAHRKEQDQLRDECYATQKEIQADFRKRHQQNSDHANAAYRENSAAREENRKAKVEDWRSVWLARDEEIKATHSKVSQELRNEERKATDAHEEECSERRQALSISNEVRDRFNERKRKARAALAAEMEAMEKQRRAAYLEAMVPINAARDALDEQYREWVREARKPCLEAVLESLE